MAVQLEIRDGSPNWWASPDIWVVPGDDPTGTPGTPIVGQTAFVWAHVENHGSSPASGTRVDFWWADPSTQVLRSNAHLIGSSFVDLAPGAAEDVLCLVAWNVELVNDGHECLVAVASHSGDSVPDPAPDDFAPTQYPEIAQRNLTVLVASMQMMMIVVAARKREGKRARLRLEAGGKLEPDELVRLGLSGFKPAGKAKVRARLSDKRPGCGGEDSGKGEKLDLPLRAGERKAIYLAVGDAKLERGEYQLLHVVERAGERVVGGCSVVLVAEAPERKQPKVRQGRSAT